MPSISALPPEILVYLILLSLPARDVLSLGSTNRHFHSYCNDDLLWQRKCEEDFQEFKNLFTGRGLKWIDLYKGLSNPKIYVWGRLVEGQLGVPLTPRRLGTSRGRITSPTLLSVSPKLKGIIQLEAADWSINVLTRHGQLYVFGTLDATYGHRGNDERFVLPNWGTTIETPSLVDLPSQLRRLSGGNYYLTAMDEKNHLWTFRSWSQPYRLNSHLLDNTSQSTTIAQVAAGHTFCSVLTESGIVYVWWTNQDSIERQVFKRMIVPTNSKPDYAWKPGERVILTDPWDIDGHVPRRLPDLPDLPDLTNSTEGDIGADPESHQRTKLVKIAAADDVLLGLTNKGQVVRFMSLSKERYFELAAWEYLPFFSEIEKVKQNPAFTEENGPQPPKSFKITDITARYKNFVAYSTGADSIILCGNVYIEQRADATIIPELRHKAVISVVQDRFGYYTARTVDGKVYTSGPSLHGAGELGGVEEPRQSVDIPTHVTFDGREQFCAAITAGREHTAALVFDL